MLMYSEHYRRDWLPVYEIVAEFWDTYDRGQRRAMLEGLFPGVDDLFACWHEVAHLVAQLAALDVPAAVSELQERGGYNGDPGAAYDAVRGELELALRGVVDDHRRAGAAQDARPRLAVAS